MPGTTFVDGSKDFARLLHEELQRTTLAVERIEEPLDEYERLLVQQIEQLQRQYHDAARPLIDALARSRAVKVPRFVLATRPRI